MKQITRIRKAVCTMANELRKTGPKTVFFGKVAIDLYNDEIY